MAFYRGGNNVGRGSLPWEEDFWEDCSWCFKSCAGEKKETETEEERLESYRERQIVKEKKQIAKEKRQFEAKRQGILWEIKDCATTFLRKLENVSWEEGNEYKLTTDLSDCSGVKYRFYVSDDMENTGTIEKEIVGNNDNTFTFDKKWNNVFVAAATPVAYLQEVTVCVGEGWYKGKIVDVASGFRKNTVLYCVKLYAILHGPLPYKMKVWYTIKRLQLMQKCIALDYEEYDDISKCIELNLKETPRMPSCTIC